MNSRKEGSSLMDENEVPVEETKVSTETIGVTKSGEKTEEAAQGSAGNQPNSGETEEPEGVGSTTKESKPASKLKCSNCKSVINKAGIRRCPECRRRLKWPKKA